MPIYFVFILNLVDYFVSNNGSAQLRMIFILLINVKMPTIVDILTFISRINKTSEISNLKAMYSF